jgi:type IV pilus assembly protein PilM
MFTGSRGIVTAVDVGSSSVKAVRLAHGRGASELLGAAIAEIQGVGKSDVTENDARMATVSAITRAFVGLGIEPQKAGTIVSSVGGTSVSVKHVKFPKMKDSELNESAMWEARKHIPFDAVGADIACARLARDESSHEDSMHVLLAAAQEGMVDERVRLLAEAGAEPAVVDLTTLALLNEVDAEGLLNGGAVAVLELGRSFAHLSVYASRGLLLSRSIPIGDKEDTWLEHVLTEVRFSLAFYNNETGKKGIEAVYLSGGRALDEFIRERFEDELGVDVRLLDPLGSVASGDVDMSELRAQSPRFALAMGLARRR